MIALGYFLGLLIGICLGMMGAGGAIMTIPVLVYLFHIDTMLATFYSLFIVGITAFIGTIGYIRNKLFDAKTVFFFGFPSIISVILTVRLLLPAIPNILWETPSFTLTKQLLLLVLFAVLMMISAVAMMKSSRAIKTDEYHEFQRYRYVLIMLQGLLVGLVTGLFGAGGGFIIVPALVVLAHLPMKKAVGTSLCIITINCVIGFISKYGTVGNIDWSFLMIFTSLTAAGILTGVLISRRISGEKLKKIFAVFMLVMGTFILVKETLGVKESKQEAVHKNNVAEKT